MARTKSKANGTSKDAILISGTSQTRAFGRPKPVPVTVLAENVQIFLGQMGTVLDKGPEQIGKFHLMEISVTVEVTAKGEVSLLGTGFGLEGKGGLSFVFKRESS